MTQAMDAGLGEFYEFMNSTSPWFQGLMGTWSAELDATMARLEMRGLKDLMKAISME